MKTQEAAEQLKLYVRTGLEVKKYLHRNLSAGRCRFFPTIKRWHQTTNFSERISQFSAVAEEQRVTLCVAAKGVVPC